MVPGIVGGLQRKLVVDDKARRKVFLRWVLKGWLITRRDLSVPYLGLRSIDKLN